MSESEVDVRNGTLRSEATSQGNQAKKKPPKEIKVAIVGAGMAGLTAALRLAERGYTVKIYEEKPYVGGQFGAHTHDDDPKKNIPQEQWLYHEHCYHMLLNWYHNFWQIVDDIGLDRYEDFEPRAAVRHLAQGDFRMPALVNPGSANHVWDNLLSGVASPPDMFLYAYSLIDLLTHPIQPEGLLGKYTVNGFLQTRPYASERSAELHQHTLTKAFGAPSYLTSAASYKNLVKFGLRLPEPMMWIVKGDAERHFHSKMREALKDTQHCEIEEKTRITSIGFQLSGRPRLRKKPSSYTATLLEGAKVPQALHFKDCTLVLPDCSRNLPSHIPSQSPTLKGNALGKFDYLIVAVPPRGLKDIEIKEDKKQGDPDILKASLPPIPRIKLGLPPIPKLKVQPMASLDLYFNRRLPNVAREHVVLVGSQYGLTYIDNSQVGSGHEHAVPTGKDGTVLHGCTVLNVVASDFGALSNLTPDEAICAILHELAKYVPFDPQHDLVRIHFQTNIGDELFVNEVGSEQWRPGTRTMVPNMFLAGDYCRTFVDVVSIEAAVVSGLEAARAVQTAVTDKYDIPEGHEFARPIDIAEPEAYGEAEVMALKLALAPYAYAARYWSSLQEGAAPPAAGVAQPHPFAPFPDPFTAPADVFTAGTKLMVAPWVMAADFLTAGASAWADFVRQLGRAR